MKDIRKFFTRRYSAVHTEDEQQWRLPESARTSPVAALQYAALANKQPRKSLKPSRTMNPADILSTFFNERQSNKGARSPKRAFLLLALGVLAISTAVVVNIFQPYDFIFKWKIVMEDNGEIFNLWEKPPVDLYIKIYLFNITNAEAFLAGREKLNVEEVGPYVYKEIMTHENVTFNSNKTMSTIPSHPLVWQEHLSKGRKEDDKVIMLNIAMLAISHLTADKSLFMRMGLNALFISSKSTPIVHMTAKEFMFGYPSSLTTLGNTFLPNWIHFDKVGLIDRMYDFTTDYETFYTGASNPAISGLYATYRGNVDLPQWKGEHCSNIQLASDGTKFKSFIQANESVKFFRKSMCRPINLYRSGEPEMHGSLEGYKFIFEKNAFDNGGINHKNKCFCRKGYCQPQGLIDVTDCYYGFPISLSYPHFIDGDPGLENNVTGLKPNKDGHSSVFVIQPQSGLPLSLSVKIQINMHFQNLATISKVSRFSYLTPPMLWFEIIMPKLPDALDTRFNFYINILPYVDVISFWGSLMLGIALLVYAVTRATLRMSTFAQAGTISDGKYGKANLLRSTGNYSASGANVAYNSCEVKLLHMSEKSEQQSINPHRQQHSHQTQNSCLAAATYSNTDESLYAILDLKQIEDSAYTLEAEPALSEVEVTDDDSSDNNILTRHSTASSCIFEHNEKEVC